MGGRDGRVAQQKVFQKTVGLHIPAKAEMLVSLSEEKQKTVRE